MTETRKKLTGRFLFFGGILLALKCASAQAAEVAVTNPREGQAVSGLVPLVAAVSSDVVAVQWRADGAQLGKEVTAPPFSMVWYTHDQAPGRHVIEAVARDAAGNQAASAPVTVRVIAPRRP